MAALASDWLRYFRLLLWNRLMEFNETWQGARSQRPLPSLCFSGRSKKTRWPRWSLIGWDIFDFFSKASERNSMKLDRKQDLNVLYQVCVFWADRKNKMAALASDWLRHIWLLLRNRWTEFNETWQEARSQCPLPSLCFSGRSENKNGCPGWFLKKVAHCTQVHDMWPFGPLVCFDPTFSYFFFKSSHYSYFFIKKNWRKEFHVSWSNEVKSEHYINNNYL